MPCIPSALDNCYMLSFPRLVGVAFFPPLCVVLCWRLWMGPQYFILLFMNFATFCSCSTPSWACYFPQFNTSLTFVALFSLMAATITWFPLHDDCYKSCKHVFVVTLRRVWKSKLKKRRCPRQRSVESCLLWVSLRWVLVEFFAYSSLI